jgi:hypothetical protein
MKKYTTSEARKQLAHIVNVVVYKNEVIGIGRRDKTEALIIKYPENINQDLTVETNINANSSSFDFLDAEPDVYSLNDLKKKYV